MAELDPFSTSAAAAGGLQGSLANRVGFERAARIDDPDFGEAVRSLFAIGISNLVCGCRCACLCADCVRECLVVHESESHACVCVFVCDQVLSLPGHVSAHTHTHTRTDSVLWVRSHATCLERAAQEAVA
jgi:hypothetical protein